MFLTWSFVLVGWTSADPFDDLRAAAPLQAAPVVPASAVSTTNQQNELKEFIREQYGSRLGEETGQTAATFRGLRETPMAAGSEGIKTLEGMHYKEGGYGAGKYGGKYGYGGPTYSTTYAAAPVIATTPILTTPLLTTPTFSSAYSTGYPPLPVSPAPYGGMSPWNYAMTNSVWNRYGTWPRRLSKSDNASATEQLIEDLKEAQKSKGEQRRDRMREAGRRYLETARDSADPLERNMATAMVTGEIDDIILPERTLDAVKMYLQAKESERREGGQSGAPLTAAPSVSDPALSRFLARNHIKEQEDVVAGSVLYGLIKSKVLAAATAAEQTGGSTNAAKTNLRGAN